MIRIRYKDISDISAGAHQETWLHGRTQAGGQGVMVYLVPGLTTGQRRAVLRRLRQEASRGLGPALPLPQLLLALAGDRLRTAARMAGAIIRLHPAEALLPSALIAGLMALFVVVSAGSPGAMTGIQGQPAPPPAGGAAPGSVAAWTSPVLVTKATVRLDERAGQDGPGSPRQAPGELLAGGRLPGFGQPSGWYDCSGVVAAPVWFPLLGQPVSQPCSSSRAAP